MPGTGVKESRVGIVSLAAGRYTFCMENVKSRLAVLPAAFLLAAGLFAGVGPAAAQVAPPPGSAVPAVPVQLRGEALLKALGVQFVRIPGGEFEMGAPEEVEVDAPNPPRRVVVRPFELSRYEITQAQWEMVMGSNPSLFTGCPACPVEQVSWDMAHQFLDKVAELTGERWRLPTEAEWEFAAGEGAAHRRWAGTDDVAEIGEYAWFRPNAGMRTHPVGQKRPNAFGLYDMNGNVYEWCEDWLSRLAPGEGPVENPAGPAKGQYKILRGGSYGLVPHYQRTCYREWAVPERGYDDNGLRPARDSR